MMVEIVKRGMSMMMVFLIVMIWIGKEVIKMIRVIIIVIEVMMVEMIIILIVMKIMMIIVIDDLKIIMIIIGGKKMMMSIVIEGMIIVIMIGEMKEEIKENMGMIIVIEWKIMVKVLIMMMKIIGK